MKHMKSVWGFGQVRSVCWGYYHQIRRLFKRIMRGNKGLCLNNTSENKIMSSYLQSVTLTHSLLKTMQRSCSVEVLKIFAIAYVYPIITDLKKESVCSGKLVFLCWMRFHTCLYHMFLLHCMQHELKQSYKYKHPKTYCVYLEWGKTDFWSRLSMACYFWVCFSWSSLALKSKQTGDWLLQL